MRDAGSATCARLLWADGPALHEAVHSALAILGLKPHESGEGFAAGGELLLLETEGSEAEIGLAAHHRLRRRREEHLEAQGVMPRGLLVVNGFRDLPPDDRLDQYTPALAAAAESQRYALLTGQQLFDLATTALENGAEPALVRRLLATEGPWQAAAGEPSSNGAAEMPAGVTTRQ